MQLCTYVEQKTCSCSLVSISGFFARYWLDDRYGGVEPAVEKWSGSTHGAKQPAAWVHGACEDGPHILHGNCGESKNWVQRFQKSTNSSGRAFAFQHERDITAWRDVHQEFFRLSNLKEDGEFMQAREDMRKMLMQFSLGFRSKAQAKDSDDGGLVTMMLN